MSYTAPGGFLNLLKPPGLSSTHAVGAVKRRVGERRIGHLGTLDPLAAGVLPLAVGWATRLIPYLPEGDKVYVAEALLGCTTDSQDLAGRVVSNRPVPALKRDALEAELARWVGPQEQIPPMASAVHHQGQRLYHLFRQGHEVERAPRPIRIVSVELLRWTPPRLLFRVRCSAGTYVRTLCHDLGERLGCGACMSFLVRVRSGIFAIEDAHPIENVDVTALIDPNRCLQGLPALTLDETRQPWVSNGRSLPPADVEHGFVRLVSDAGDLWAIARSDDRGVHPHCVLPTVRNIQ